MTDFKVIPLSEIHPDPNQPRKFHDEAAMTELTQSVKEKGVLQPILLRPNGNGYIIVCGERRYRASGDAGLKEIPAVIRELSDDEALELQIIENLQRKDVHPMEEAVAFKSLMDGKKWTIQEISNRVGKKDYYIRQRLKLNDLVGEWQILFYKNAFPLTEALQLCLLPEKAQKDFYKDQVRDGGTRVSINTYQLNQYKGDLHKATFELTDPTLDKKIGPCTACQFNTAVSLLFPEHADSPRCMNISCFKHKSDISFEREFNKAKEDPTIVLITTEPRSSKLVEDLRKEGHQVLKSYNDYSSVDAPVKPDWEEYKEENYFEEEGHEIDEVTADFKKELENYEKEKAAFEKKIGTGKYKKAFEIAGYNPGRYIYIELKKQADQKTAKAAVESGDAGVEDINSEIERLKDREKRAKELDGEKIHAIVKSIFLQSTEFAKNANQLSRVEITSAAVALVEAGGYSFRDRLKKEKIISADAGYGTSSLKLHKDFENLTELGLNQIIRLFCLDKLNSGYGSHLTHSTCLAAHNIAIEYHPDQVATAEKNQQEKAARRQITVDGRIAELQKKKKELQTAAKPEKATKKPSPKKAK